MPAKLADPEKIADGGQKIKAEGKFLGNAKTPLKQGVDGVDRGMKGFMLSEACESFKDRFETVVDSHQDMTESQAKRLGYCADDWAAADNAAGEEFNAFDQEL
ncbi:hypothetical protein [Glycomyces buryatensis]|uniref:Uncharacterized protein n=1 Tax=Glycomyces buryatensis TaxID=2570927 RepID=A0A4S8PVB9_9ACTN|nr:hypothetical protein [Glycomyces buryatensis]THV34391.1 hypothetical protein FAB82_24365 [Glycomyces buryatensis]